MINTKRKLSTSPDSLRNNSRRINTRHKSPGWEEKYPVEAAVKEAMVEAMAKGEAGDQPVGATRMNDPTKQTLSSSRQNLKMQCLTLAQ